MSPTPRAASKAPASRAKGSRSKSDEDGDEVESGSRPLWRGVLTFGLVEIPVSLHSASTRAKAISFTLLDRRDLSPVGYERVNKKTGKPVDWDDIVKGYEHEAGEFVVLSEAEIRDANVKASQTIEIVDFVEAAEIDAAYWDTPYFVKPAGKRKSKAYALLREALGRTGKVGIAQVVIRTRQRLAAVRVQGDVLVLNVMRYAYELNEPGVNDLPDSAGVGVQEKEVAMAERLIESMTTGWKPRAYEDQYQHDILALVKRKVAAGRSKEIEQPKKGQPSETRRTEVLDLMPLLEKSMKSDRGARVRAVSVSPRRSAAKTARRRPA